MAAGLHAIHGVKTALEQKGPVTRGGGGGGGG